MFWGVHQTEEKYIHDVPSFVIYVPKETKEKVEMRNILMETYQLDITKADWLADNINVASKMYHVPTEIMLALVAVESSFDEHAVSSSNAVGFTQVVPSVWGDEIPYDVYNPAENILAGAYVLNNYRIKCGDWQCALKAYNIGITDYKKGKQKSAAKRYVKKITEELKRMNMATLDSFINPNRS
jgi:soluble lytic murein transglycosylase-like protein